MTLYQGMSTLSLEGRLGTPRRWQLNRLRGQQSSHVIIRDHIFQEEENKLGTKLSRTQSI